MAEINITVNFENSFDRAEAAEAAGDEYVAALEEIRDSLIKEDGSSTSLGKMVRGQLEMTEAETQYMVKAGLPKKAAGAVKEAAADIKKASG